MDNCVHDIDELLNDIVDVNGTKDIKEVPMFVWLMVKTLRECLPILIRFEFDVQDKRWNFNCEKVGDVTADDIKSKMGKATTLLFDNIVAPVDTPYQKLVERCADRFAPMMWPDFQIWKHCGANMIIYSVRSKSGNIKGSPRILKASLKDIENADEEKKSSKRKQEEPKKQESKKQKKTDQEETYTLIYMTDTDEAFGQAWRIPDSKIEEEERKNLLSIVGRNVREDEDEIIDYIMWRLDSEWLDTIGEMDEDDDDKKEKIERLGKDNSGCWEEFLVRRNHICEHIHDVDGPISHFYRLSTVV